MTWDRDRLIRLGAAVVLVGGALLLSSYYLNNRSGTLSPPSTVSPIPTKPRVPPVIPRIQTVLDLPSVLAELRGRPVAVLIWTPHLPYSQAILAAVDAAVFEGDTAAIGIALNGSASEAEEACILYGITWPQYVMSAGDHRWSKWLKISSSAPQLVLIDRGGNVVDRGRPDKEAWARLRALAGTRPSLTRRHTLGRLEWNGQTLADLEANTPRFWFRDETRMVEAELQVNYEPETSRFRISDVEAGLFGISIFIGHVTKGPENAYRAWKIFGVPVTADVPEIIVPLIRAIHLRKPIDNAVDSGRNGLMTHQSPVEFRWETLQGADHYRVLLQRQARTVEATSTPEAFFEDTVTTTSMSFDLDEGWIYTLQLNAYRDRVLIGRIWGSGDSWAGASYRFEIGELKPEAYD